MFGRPPTSSTACHWQLMRSGISCGQTAGAFRKHAWHHQCLPARLETLVKLDSVCATHCLLWFDFVGGQTFIGGGGVRKSALSWRAAPVSHGTGLELDRARSDPSSRPRHQLGSRFSPSHASLLHPIPFHPLCLLTYIWLQRLPVGTASVLLVTAPFRGPTRTPSHCHAAHSLKPYGNGGPQQPAYVFRLCTRGSCEPTVLHARPRGASPGDRGYNLFSCFALSLPSILQTSASAGTDDVTLNRTPLGATASSDGNPRYIGHARNERFRFCGHAAG